MSETPVTDTVDQPVATSSVIIRPWPKVVFFYPTFVCATLLWILSLVSSGDGASAWQGNLFMLVFFFNLLVFAFDFSRIKSLTLLILVVAIVLGVLWANTMWSVVGFLKDLVDTINHLLIRLSAVEVDLALIERVVQH